MPLPHSPLLRHLAQCHGVAEITTVTLCGCFTKYFLYLVQAIE
ncbi:MULTISPECIES: hypothetical protein [Citrobacter]|nr:MULTISPECIES: hypothetical protein [Citrobacter]